MKVKAVLMTMIILSLLFMGCAKKDDGEGDTTPTPTADATPETTQAPTTDPTTAPTTAPELTPTPGTDAVTSASIVNEEEAFVRAISKDGTWIICLLKDMTINQDITLDGEFTNGKKDDAGKDIIQRKVALYTQDESRNITNRFTLTAPKFTINSPEASIQHGTLKGDLYVNTENFQLVDTTVDGSVYFKDADVKSSFTMDETSNITGKQDLQ
ncbi:MAG TPA: hypothetical protein VJ888_04635 [Mobilitalea sp.]|nr:hypothetical protein [Mobilitalea sp.]